MTETVAGISAVATLVLVAVTWKYVKSTETIASETASTAKSARDAAQISLIQALLNVQPLLEVTDLKLEYLANAVGSPARPAPLRVRWNVSNAGSGTAFNVTLRVVLGGTELSIVPDAPPIPHLAKAESVSGVHQVQPQDRGPLSTVLGEIRDDPIGGLYLSCRDSFGSTVECETDVFASGTTVRCGIARRRYEGGPELHELLRKLLDRILN